MEAPLRVKILIRRYELPDFKIVWSIPRRQNLTIADLLVKINQIAPLESGEWGLEDYAVEVLSFGADGFECLHYQIATEILRDEDQVLYVSLNHSIKPFSYLIHLFCQSKDSASPL